MVADKNIFLMEIHTVVNFKMEGLMELEAISGRMIMLSIKGILRMDWDMEKVNGQKDKQDIMVHIVKDWNKGTDNYIFQVAIFIKETLFKIKNKVMVKCFGQIVAFIKVNGEMVFKMVRVKYIWQEMI